MTHPGDNETSHPGLTDIGRLIEDCQVLLQHVTRLPDTRLDWCFEETRGRVAGSPPARLASPPSGTASKAAFLERLVRLGCRQGGPPGPSPVADAEDIAFLIDSRDFLAGLAWPATVDSIRISEEYNRSGLFGALARLPRRLRDAFRGDGASPSERPSRARRFARSLAVQVGLWHVFALGLVALTILVSIYALIGRGLLLEVRANDAAFGLLSGDMDKAEQADAAIFLAALTGAGREPPVDVQNYRFRRYCEQAEWAADGKQPHDRFLTRQQQKLCDRYTGYNSTLVSLLERLRDWHEQRPGWAMPGMRHASKQAAASSGTARPVVLADAGGRGVATDPASRPDAARLGLVQELRLEEATANVVMQSIAEYVLPCLYAMLGALAAALRHVARRAETSTLDFSDDGVIPRTLVLGVLFGAVIGLFASQLGDGARAATGGGEVVASLTPAAVSLLAGYSVTRVFEFFDGLSVRVFGARPPAEPARPG